MNTIPNPIPSSLEAPGKDIADVKGFLASKSQEMLDRVRNSLIRADTTYRAQRAAIVNRMQDEVQRLDAQHDRIIGEHQMLIAKLEELRS